MSVSQKQTVEIVKVLYRGADILILDEPTAVLTPQETDKLFAVLRAMRADGKAIVIITHKLHEVMALSDKVAVLRKGRKKALDKNAIGSLWSRKKKGHVWRRNFTVRWQMGINWCICLKRMGCQRRWKCCAWTPIH